jgi:hypothetical protein
VCTDELVFRADGPSSAAILWFEISLGTLSATKDTPAPETRGSDRGGSVEVADVDFQTLGGRVAHPVNDDASIL